jgi:glycerol-3-phosphate acyltransferase PlsY
MNQSIEFFMPIAITTVGAIETALIWIGCYFLGAIPFGFIAGKLKGVDLRTQGSGNIGATNAYRVLGKGWGVAVFLLDFAKAFVPLFVLGRALSDRLGALPSDMALVVGGICAVVGHNYSPFLGFKGGKGMAAGAGFLAALMPAALGCCAGLWALVFVVTRYVSVASIASACLLPLAAWFFYPEKPAFWCFSLVLAGMNVWRHRPNITRLMKGTEHRLVFRKKENDIAAPDTKESRT